MKIPKINLVTLRPIPPKTDLKKYKFRFYRNMRNKKIMVRLTEFEYEKLSKNVQIPLAKFIRESALGNVIVRRIHPPKVDKKLLQQIAYIGNNLNQLTHAVNSQKKKNEPLELLTIATELTLIRESLERIENQYTVKNDNGIDENAS